MSTPSGIESVEYDDAGNSFAASTDMGRIHGDSGFPNNDVPSDEVDTQGQPYWAGAFVGAQIHFSDLSKIADLETEMTSENPLDWRITFTNGNTLTLEGVYHRVWTEFGEGPGEIDVGIVEFTEFRATSTIKYD